jgi:hypothetical protein
MLRQYNSNKLKIYGKRQAVNEMAIKGTDKERRRAAHDIHLLGKVRFMDRKYREVERYCSCPKLVFLFGCKSAQIVDNHKVIPHRVCRYSTIVAVISFVIFVFVPLFIMVPAYRVAGNLSVTYTDEEGQALLVRVIMGIAALSVVTIVGKIVLFMARGRFEDVRLDYIAEQRNTTMNALGFTKDGMNYISKDDANDAHAILLSGELAVDYERNKVSRIKLPWM